jgi:PAS domain S-box-containing protein
MQEEAEPKHSEEALRASELRYRRLFETAQDGILILDAHTGLITDVNPFLVNLLGYSFNEFIGTPLWEIGPFKDIKECKLAFLELQEKEYIRYESLPLETKDGRSIAVEFVSNVYGLSGATRVIQCFPFTVDHEPTGEVENPCIYCRHEVTYTIDLSRFVNSPEKCAAWQAAFLKSHKESFRTHRQRSR